MRIISTPEGTFLYDRITGTCFFTDIKKAEKWQNPLYVQIALTQQCNLQCWHCYNTITTTVSSLSSNGGGGCEWSVDRLKRLVQYLDRWGVFGVAFGGGEPFMYPYLQEIAKYTWEQTKLDSSITTNGYAAKEDQINALEGCVSEIRVSIRYLSDCGQLDKFLNRAFEVGVNLLLHHGNVPMLERIIDKCRDLGVKDFLINSFVATGQGANFTNKLPGTKDFAAFSELVNQHTEKDLTFKVSSRLATNLTSCLLNGSYSFVPFQEERRGRIIAITADGKLKPSSMSTEAYPFKHESQIADIYRQKIV